MPSIFNCYYQVPIFHGNVFIFSNLAEFLDAWLLLVPATAIVPTNIIAAIPLSLIFRASLFWFRRFFPLAVLLV